MTKRLSNEKSLRLREAMAGEGSSDLRDLLFRTLSCQPCHLGGIHVAVEESFQDGSAGYAKNVR